VAAFCDRRVPLKWAGVWLASQGIRDTGLCETAPGLEPGLCCQFHESSAVHCARRHPAGKLVGWPLVGLPLDCGVDETLIRVAALLG